MRDLLVIGGASIDTLHSARRYCLGMTEPKCHRCQMDPVRAPRKELFQPVLRTTFY